MSYKLKVGVYSINLAVVPANKEPAIMCYKDNRDIANGTKNWFISQWQATSCKATPIKAPLGTEVFIMAWRGRVAYTGIF